MTSRQVAVDIMSTYSSPIARKHVSARQLVSNVSRSKFIYIVMINGTSLVKLVRCLSLNPCWAWWQCSRVKKNISDMVSVARLPIVMASVRSSVTMSPTCLRALTSTSVSVSIIGKRFTVAVTRLGTRGKC